MIIIVLGMLWIGGEMAGQTGGVANVVQHAMDAGKFSFWPDSNFPAIATFMAAWCTMMFGSMPQQDVFQRVQSAKSEKIAVWGSVLGGSLYFMFAFVPMFLAYSATLIDPEMVARLINDDPQKILPTLVLEHTPLFAQVMFFGALLSAIKSCASATLLAPSVTFSENILKPMFPEMTDKELLRNMRVVTVCFTVLVTIYAINSNASIFKMVENAYQVTLVSAFIPLAFGVYWSRATNQGAICAIFFGVGTWLALLFSTTMSGAEIAALPSALDLLIGALQPLQVLTPQGAGLLAALFGMLAGSLLPQVFKYDPHSHHKLRNAHLAKGDAITAQAIAD
jgi:Na+/proline symporter